MVDLNDLVFALHATTVTFAVVLQIIFYDKAGQRVSLFGWTVILVAIILIGLESTLIATETSIPFLNVRLGWLDLIYSFSKIKLLITATKYIPQVFLNYLRRSTSGWSIVNIWLDFSGGLLSIGQLLLDAGLSDNWNGVWGNPVKLWMGLLSLVFDVIFFGQHYVLFRRKVGDLGDDQDSVLDEEESDNGEVDGGAGSIGGDQESTYRDAKETDPLLPR